MTRTSSAKDSSESPVRSRGFNECSTKLAAAFAEGYRVEVISGGCWMMWTLAQKPAGPAKLVMFVVSPLLNLGLRRFLTNLRRYTDKRFDATPLG